MSLPFLQKKKIAAFVKSRRKGSEIEVKSEIVPGSEGTPDGMMDISDQMMRAIHEKSVHGLAEALRAHKEMPIAPESDSDKDLT